MLRRSTIKVHFIRDSFHFTFSQVQHTHTLRMRNVTEIALTTSNMGNLCLLLTHTQKKESKKKR